MRITKVHIENYRSIKKLTFEPGPYCVLIGENNSGKTNILKALNLVLGEIWPSERSFSEEDFHNQDTNQDIVIQVFFDEMWEEWRNKAKMEVAGFELRCHALQRSSGVRQRGELSVTYSCITKTGRACTYPSEPGNYKSRPLPFKVTNDLRERVPFIYVDVLREYDKQGPSSRWSILRKLFNDVNTEFLNDNQKVSITVEAQKQMMTRKEAFEFTVNQAYKFLRTEKFVEIEQKLASNVLEQMGIQAEEGGISLHFNGHDPAHAYKNLQLMVEQMGITSAASHVGAGLQSAIVVGIFRTYEELKKEGAIFALEEPEVFLHPQKARYFESVLQGLAETGNQVFVTTHSPVFVQIHNPESVALVCRTVEKGTWVSQTTKVDLAENDRKALRLMSEFDAQRNELFFARKVMLVEGNTEKITLPLAFKAMGHDVNQLGVSIVEVGGKTQFPLFIKVLKALEIPFVVLVDYDIREIKDEWSEKRKEDEEKRNQKHERWNNEIKILCEPDQLFWMNPNFEGELGLSSNESDKLDQALEKFQNIKKAEIPESLKVPIHKLLGITEEGFCHPEQAAISAET